MLGRSIISSSRFLVTCTPKSLHSELLKCCSCKPMLPGYMMNLNKNIRHYSKFVRIAKNVYFPETDGIVDARKSLAKLPKSTKETVTLQRLKTSGELFKSVMGEIFASKSKHLIAVEGARQVDDAISFGLKLKMLFLLKTLKTYPDNVRKLVENEETSPLSSFDSKSMSPEIHRISLSAFQDWSVMNTMPGIVGIFEKPKPGLQKASCIQSLPLTVVLDNIREPGNLGSILRTAAGVGCKVLISEGCVDPWETKSLRGGNGAQFLIPMMTKVDLRNLHQYIPLPDATPQDWMPSEEKHLTSNADAGVNECKDSRSLGGIGVFLADSGTNPDEFGIPIIDYTSAEYSKFKSIVLVLGGETSGLSTTIKKSVCELPNYYRNEIKCISRIKIPMSLPIDSLNVANAFGIIGYEILRQFSSNNTRDNK